MRTIQASLLMDAGPADLDLAIEELAALRKRIRELESRAKPLYEAVLAALTKAGLHEFTTSDGTMVRLHTTDAGINLETE